ncbi:Nif11-like leader peptide family RiPP precursor [Massilia solisilvae]|uniref:Nif11-like leader peptide family RiPP n=1 Tax=Massilia solisilvae TaxID=1811225 RepID=A0ABT2BN64_9BURK|nr:Nif11-like leader peptide family RiPP precursor [Massilia solisilvae]MCS0609957.1 Nif11-like leader peptide family RiPP precursor [Massilia solisilvae]
MSIQAAQAFRQQTNTSPALQAEVARHVSNGTIDYAALAELGRKHGHDFTAEDAVTVLSAPSDELSDFEMELVSGGTLIPPQFSKRDRPMGG